MNTDVLLGVVALGFGSYTLYVRVRRRSSRPRLKPRSPSLDCPTGGLDAGWLGPKALEVVGEPLVVDVEEMQVCRPEVPHVHRVFDDVVGTRRFLRADRAIKSRSESTIVVVDVRIFHLPWIGMG